MIEGGFDPRPLKTLPIIVDGNTTASPAPMTILLDNMGSRERAQTLQVLINF